jgi:nucleotide-binding universal stress UspA family protein
MYSQIVVPLDTSELAARALAPARVVGRACDAPVVAVTCVNRPEDVDRRTDAVRAQLADAGLADTEVRAVVVSRSVAEGIAGLVEEQPGSLVVMSSIARTRSAPLIGSVTDELLHLISQPVLVVGPHADVAAFDLTGPLLAAVDGSKTSETILPIVAAWATSFGLEPWIVTVLDRSALDALAASGPDPVSESSYVHRLAADLRRELDRPVEFDTLHGPRPASAVTDAALEHQAAIVAVSTHGRTGLRRVALGSVATSIVHHAPCPVLVNRPLPRRHDVSPKATAGKA